MCKEFTQGLTSSHLQGLDLSSVHPGSQQAFHWTPSGDRRNTGTNVQLSLPCPALPLLLDLPSVTWAEPTLGVFAFDKSHLYPDAFTGSPMPPGKLY